MIGLASDLVHVEKEYQVLAKYLLGRVVVADTIDHAIVLARKFKYSLRIVTLEGELFSAGGSMTGGAFKKLQQSPGTKTRTGGTGGGMPEGAEGFGPFAGRADHE